MEFDHYDHERLDRIHLQDAASALLDLFPSISGKRVKRFYKQTSIKPISSIKRIESHTRFSIRLQETQAEFLFSDLKYKNEVSFEEWFSIVHNFYQMCAQVHSNSTSMVILHTTIIFNNSIL